jgi:putative FmdB family regulatory protein
MPTYEYICRACGHEFERFQPITSDPVRVCPECRRAKVHRKIGIGAGVLFKGGGFYETDYRSESYEKAKAAETKDAAPKEAGAKETGAGELGSAPAESGTKKAETPAKSSTPAAAAAPPPTDSKATHPSRVGRGLGNIVQRPPAPKARKSAASTPRGAKARKSKR